VTAVRTVSIPTGDIRTAQFNLTADQADELFRAGYETAKAFFARTPGEQYRNSFARAPTRRKTPAKQAGTVP
jgi:hypothetical protein